MQGCWAGSKVYLGIMLKIRYVESLFRKGRGAQTGTGRGSTASPKMKVVEVDVEEKV